MSKRLRLREIHDFHLPTPGYGHPGSRFDAVSLSIASFGSCMEGGRLPFRLRALELLMTASPREKLLDMLHRLYPDLKRQMTRRLGSVDLAEEALHDVYVRLHHSEGVGEIRNLKSYLYTMVSNTAKNLVRSEARRSAAFRPTEELEVPDMKPTPAQIAEARSDMEAVERALLELPPRRLALFRRAWLEDMPYADIAREFGLAERTVRHELQMISRHLYAAVKEKSLAELQSRLAAVSLEGRARDE